MPETRQDRASTERTGDSAPRNRAPGILESNGERIILLAPSVVVNVQKQLEETVGISARGFLYLAGARSGKAIVENLTDRPSRHDEFWRAALERLSAQGWGHFVLTVVDAAGGKYSVGLDESAIASSYGSSKKPVCHLLAGFIAGLTEALHGRTLLCDEIACESQGRPRCEFEVRPTLYA